MCGFAACFSPDAPVSESGLRAAALRLNHRGPDNQSVWTSSDRRAGSAHARLSLLDLSSNGDQPLRSSDGRLAVVHNGEFYDFERIKRELAGRGHHFRTSSDSEILLPLYAELGTAALARLRGEFAFVLWDEPNRQVFAARDRFGIKPLFYAVHEGQLFFASEVKALFALGVPPAWDYETVHNFHATLLIPPSRTLYKNVYQVPPGHFLTASRDSGLMRPMIQSYWDFNYPLAEQAVQRRPVEEEVLALREKFEEAVKLRLRADVPVASYLSGGLDSCSILGAAARMVSTPIHAFTLSFVDDAAYDESQVAREMARFCGAEYHEIPIRWTDLAENFSDALWNAELPIANTHVVAKYLLSKHVRAAGFKAVMTGEGSDEIFGGYVHFRKDMAVTRGGPDLAAQLARLADANPVSRPLMLSDETPPSCRTLEQTLGFVPAFLAAHAAMGERSASILSPDFQARFAGRDSWRLWLNQIDVPGQLWGRPPLHQSLYLWSRTLLPQYLLTALGDRMEMAHSIEGRVPFLDHELVEHVVKLPADLKIGADLTEKYLLREAAKPFLTETVYKRQKHPFMAPPAAASPTSALFDYMQSTFRSAAFRSNPFYDHDKVIQLIDAVPNMTLEQRHQIDGGLMTILSFATLQERLGIGT